MDRKQKKTIKRTAAALAVMAMLLMVMTACGQTGDIEQESRDKGTKASSSLTEEIETSGKNNKNTVTVYTAAELIRIIAPDTHIILKPGDYNFSALTEEEIAECSAYVNSDALGWGEFSVRNAPGLILEAEESGTGRLITENGYADVMTLTLCDGAVLKGLILGHEVEKGACDAYVLEIDSSENVTLEDCGLFGCGTYGIWAERAAGLMVTGTEIYECTGGIFTLSETTEAVFDRCRFYDNEGMFNLWEQTEVLVRDTEISNNRDLLLPDYNSGFDTDTIRISFQGCTFRDNPDMGSADFYPCASFENCDLTEPAFTSNSSDDPYFDLLSEFRYMAADPYRYSDAKWPGAQGTLGLIDRMIEWYGYDSPPDVMGYLIQDFSGDGVPELAIGPLPEYGEWLGALYTLVDGRPQLVFAYADDGHYAYTGNGTFFYIGNKSTESEYGQSQGMYHLTEDGTALVCDSFFFYFGEDRTVYTNTTGSWDMSKSWESGMDISDFNAWEGFEPVYETPMTAFSDQ